MKLETRTAARGLFVGLLAVLVLGACGGEESSEPAQPAGTSGEAAKPAETGAATPTTSGSAARDEAEEIFAMRCATCHGPEGRGDGPGSAALTPKPRNFQDPEWQASVDDEHIANIIQYGGAAVGKSPVMPGNPDLTSKPELVDALVSLIRELSKG